jgi:hypothetical protein
MNLVCVVRFEHGLTIQELREISNLLRSLVTAGLPLGRHWLLWVIYAVEFGYRFDGHEFWGTFQSETPGWDWLGDGRGQCGVGSRRFANSTKVFSQLALGLAISAHMFPPHARNFAQISTRPVCATVAAR